MRRLSCPLCDDRFETMDELRFHLMGRHRKSELIDLLVETPVVEDRVLLPA